MIVFFPFAFSPVCQGKFCTTRDEWAGFDEAGAKVLAISRDSVYCLRAWREQQGFKHTLLSHMRGEVARLYGAWNEAAGFAERLTVILDKDGRVSYVTRTETISTPCDQMEALAAVKAAAAG